METLPDWYMDFIASTYCPSVKPWEWDEAPVGWRERVIVAGNAKLEAESATHNVTPH